MSILNVQNLAKYNFSVINVLGSSADSTFYVDFTKSTNGYSVFLDPSYFRYAWVPELFVGGTGASNIYSAASSSSSGGLLSSTMASGSNLKPSAADAVIINQLAQGPTVVKAPVVKPEPAVQEEKPAEDPFAVVDSAEEHEPEITLPVEPEPPVIIKDPWSNDSVKTRTWGDPHFNLKGGKTDIYAFDFQGRNDTVYNMIDNGDFSIKALFSDTEDGKARFIAKQDTEFKGTGINIVTSGDNFVIYKDDEVIADKSNFKDVQSTLEENGIDLSFSKNNLVISYEGRQIIQQLKGGHVDNFVSITSEDTGLLTQTVGALDNDDNPFDGKIEIDLNEDGEISENEILFYNPDEQVMVKQKTNIGISAPVVTNDSESSEELAESFVDLATSDWHANFIDEAFEGTFEGAEQITSSNDTRLEIKDTDSEGVKFAKEAMKAELLYKEQQTEENKEEAKQAVQEWIEFSTSRINETISQPKPSFELYEKYEGYSTSQWNELLGSTFATTDSALL